MALIFYISTATIAYIIALVVYRLRFSKLAKFPGPQLAAATLWYEFYYDVICRGKYIFKIEEMHKTYGPIVRISPFELHVNDPDFYDVLYSHTAPRNKYDWFASQFGYMDTAFSTVDHEVHRPRRKAISPYFSKSKVREAEPIIEKLVNKLCDRLTVFQNTNTPVDIAAALSCFLADAISEYTTGKPLHLLDDPSFIPHWRKSVGQMAETAGVAKHIPAIHLIRTILPVSWLSALIPGMALINDYSTQCRKEIDTIIENSGSGQKSLAERNTLFAELVNSDLPPQEKSAERLQHEMEIILSAATEAPTIVLTTITFYLLNDPEKLSKLKRELAEAERSQGHPLTVSDLEQLPYLTGIIYEGLRIGHGVSARLARVVPDQPLPFQHWVIPPNTPVSMTSVMIHRNRAIFPQPDEFIPERWVDKEERHQLSRYIISFSKGSRMCAGVNLAFAEFYLATAKLFQRLNMELYDTTVDNVTLKHDLNIPRWSLDGPDVQVLIK